MGACGDDFYLLFLELIIKCLKGDIVRLCTAAINYIFNVIELQVYLHYCTGILNPWLSEKLVHHKLWTFHSSNDNGYQLMHAVARSSKNDLDCEATIVSQWAPATNLMVRLTHVSLRLWKLKLTKSSDYKISSIKIQGS